MGKPKTTTTTTADEDMPTIKNSAFLKNVALGFCPGTSFADKVCSDSPLFFLFSLLSFLKRKQKLITSFLGSFHCHRTHFWTQSTVSR